MFKFFLTKEVRKAHQPKRLDVEKYIKQSLLQKFNLVNIDVIIVSGVRSRELNLKYRGKDYPTNVISLEYKEMREGFNLLCGELILCDEVIVRESVEQNKSIALHYAHMIVHGMLHLQGLDHKNEVDAKNMEQLEIKILREMGFTNPYEL